MVLLPPSTASVCPVMKEAASEARKAIVSATSETSPTRPMAWVVLLCSRKALYLEGMGTDYFFGCGVGTE